MPNIQPVSGLRPFFKPLHPLLSLVLAVGGQGVTLSLTLPDSASDPSRIGQLKRFIMYRMSKKQSQDLRADDRLPVVSSMSGHSRGGNAQVLSNCEWTKKVVELARIIEYELQGSEPWINPSSVHMDLDGYHPTGIWEIQEESMDWFADPCGSHGL
jgi:hypothetical protein